MPEHLPQLLTEIDVRRLRDKVDLIEAIYLANYQNQSRQWQNLEAFFLSQTGLQIKDFIREAKGSLLADDLDLAAIDKYKFLMDCWL